MDGDGLPGQVCLQCVHYITRAFSFKQLCERSDSTLRQLLGKPLVASYMVDIKSDSMNDLTMQVVDSKNTNGSLKVEVMDSGLLLPRKYLLQNSIAIMLWTVSAIDNSESENDNTLLDETLLDNEERPKRDIKKKKLKDDTEQPIYPCEECTACFTTIADLKV